MTVSVGTGTVSGRVRDRVGWGEGLCRGGGGWRDGVAVLGGTVSVRPGTVTVWPGSVTVWPGSVTEGVPRRGYRGPSKTTSLEPPILILKGGEVTHNKMITTL